MMATMLRSTGLPSVTAVWRDELPLTTITTSPSPAPTASMATEKAALLLPGLNVDGLDELKLQPIQLFGLVRADDGSLHSS